jgi:hypothetical protein
VRLSDAFGALAIETLLDNSNYEWDLKLACVPEWNARLRFQTVARVVEVDFCFSCGIVQVREGGAIVGGGVLSRGSDRIFQMLAAEFPKSRVIRYHIERRKSDELGRLMIEADRALERRRKDGEPGATDNPDDAQ